MISNLSDRDKNALIILVTVIIVGIIYIYFYQPTLEQYKENKLKVEEKEVKVAELRKLNKSKLDKDRRVFLSKLTKIDPQLPNSIQSAELLYLLLEIAKDSKVELTRIEQKDKLIEYIEKPEKLEFAPYEIIVKGTNDEIQDFFAKAEDLKRKIVIGSFSLVNEDADDNKDKKYTATIAIAPFYYKDKSFIDYNKNAVIP